MRFLILLVCISVSLQAKITLNPLFSDNAILQRNQDIPVWGTANPNEEINITFAGQMAKVSADAQGTWKTKLKPLKASNVPTTMTVKGMAETIEIKNILVGEVWICSGQSNMDWKLQQLRSKARDPKDQPLADYVNELIPTLNDPLLRQIEVQKNRDYKKEHQSFQGQWKELNPQNGEAFTATGYFFARELRKSLNIPVGLIKCAWGGTRVEPWIPMETYQLDQGMKSYYDTTISQIDAQVAKYNEQAEKEKYQKAVATWKTERQAAKVAGKPFNKRQPRFKQNPGLSQQNPSALFNTMIAPLAPYAVKGAIWYQGESNSGYQNENYKKHFSAMINGWRTRWGQEQFDFYWCQLAQFKNPVENPVDNDGWVKVIYQQFLTLELPRTGMAVLNDIGEAKDIHPHNKMDAGARLAQWALNQSYGKTEIVRSGPLYQKHDIKGDKVIITFSDVADGLMTGKKELLNPTVEIQEELKHFQIKGADNKWHWAKAKIIATDQVEVSHPQVKQPIEVRYAWAANALGANLYNKAGLPASCFKTLSK